MESRSFLVCETGTCDKPYVLECGTIRVDLYLLESRILCGLFSFSK